MEETSGGAMRLGVKRLGQLRGYKVYPLSRTQSTLETIR